jgi:hypothetical protein
MIVEASIASLKVAVTAVLGQTPFPGVTESTVGGAHASLEVVKVHTKSLASAMPYTSMAPVVIVAVYWVLSARALDGVKVKIVLVVSWVIVPITPGVTVKVVALMVAGCIATLKVAVITAVGQTPAAPRGGVSEITVGGIRPGLVPVLSGSLHPAAKMSSRNAMNQM